MRPLGTQRPERPKSELWHKKNEKCGFSKAGDGEWVRTAAVDARAEDRKSGHTPRLAAVRNFPTIRSPDPKMPGWYLIQARSWWKKARKFQALFGVMIDYKPQCQQRGKP
jgi:hypothetical protein